MARSNRAAPLPGVFSRSAEVRAAEFNEADNSFEVIFTTGATVRRTDYFEGEFDETLSVEPSAVRLERLNAGAPVLASHNQRDLGAVVGSVVPGSARIANGMGIARISLAATADVADIVAKVQAGHIRNVSVGYIIHAFESRDPAPGARRQLLATDWEPLEISLVAVAADPGAQLREFAERNTGGRPISVGTLMQNLRSSGCFTPEETLSVLEIHETTPFTLRSYQEMMGHRMSERVAEGPRTINRVKVGVDAGDFVRAGIEDAFYARISGQMPSEPARQYMGLTLSQMAREWLGQRGAIDRLSSDHEVVERAMHTSSDFPLIAAAVGNRYLQDQYEAAESALKRAANPRSVRDFNQINALGLATAKPIEEVAEGGEVHYGSAVERREAYVLRTFGQIIGITRQVLINDDLGAFSSPIGLFGRACAEVEARELAALLNANAGAGVNLRDGNPLYHASRVNRAAAGTALDLPNLSLGRKAMRDMKDVDAATPVNAVPKILLVGSALETSAEQILTAIQANAIASVNPFGGKLELGVDPRLTGNGWRLFADPRQFPVLEYAYLEGAQGPQLAVREGWNVLGMEFRVHLDFGAGVVGSLGTYWNPGT
ncbi:MAG: hypothetical protein DI568_17015 [Sphingomonas sp.]|nr:MAG: hypothetical protein DI568_17015 [Sphingomonas sp.]